MDFACGTGGAGTPQDCPPLIKLRKPLLDACLYAPALWGYSLVVPERGCKSLPGRALRAPPGAAVARLWRRREIAAVAGNEAGDILLHECGRAGGVVRLHAHELGVVDVVEQEGRARIG